MDEQQHATACARIIDTYRGGYFNDRAWLREAFGSVSRAHFVPDQVWWPQRGEDGLYPLIDRTLDPERWLDAVYSARTPLITQIEDGAVTPADGATASNAFTSSISCAAVVVQMLHHLDPQPGENVLEIGTGTGYNAALLAHRVGARHLTTMEIDPATADRARRALHARGVPSPTIAVTDGESGYAARAPYDRLISTACVQQIPPAWLEQMRPGGTILTPVATPFGDDALALLTTDGHGHASGRLVAAVSFMRLRSQREPRPWRDLGWPRLPDYELTAGPDGQSVRQRSACAPRETS
ncbi:methyltransferase domain-containing protein [Streptomyces sp. cg36]|uniref:methyltransferase domain-containing protein n=1 Tax=Streptomyces sp. cg36 TaxID=3238798 RepID=UPI0034E20B52